MTMVWETYPIIKLFIILFILYFAFWKLLNLIFKKIRLISFEISFFKTLLTNFIILIIIILIGYGKISSYPLRWSDAFYSTNHFANQLAINPILYFLNTYSWKEKGYDIRHHTDSYTKTEPLGKTCDKTKIRAHATTSVYITTACPRHS